MNATRQEGLTGSAQERHGLYRCGAFRAARIRRPSIQYSRVVVAPGPNSWRPNTPLSRSVPAHAVGPLALRSSVARLLHTVG